MFHQSTPLIHMKRILSLLVIALMTCGLLLTTTSCTSKERQLEAAINALNKQFPQPIADGAVLEGFFLEGDNIDIAVTMQEDKQVEAITQERMNKMKEDLVQIFTQVAHQDKSLHDFFQLIHENQKTVSLSITTLPSKQKQQVRIEGSNIERILAAQGKTSQQMSLEQLDKILESDAKQLPINMGPMVCNAMKRDGQVIVYEFEVDEDNFDFGGMAADPQGAKDNVLKAQDNPQNLNLNRLVLDADCHILFRYRGNKSAKVFEIELTQQDLRNIQKNAVSTKIESK